MYLINILSTSVEISILNKLIEYYKQNYDNNILLFINQKIDYNSETNKNNYKIVNANDISVFYSFVMNNIDIITNYNNIVYLELNEEQLEIEKYSKLFYILNEKQINITGFLHILHDFQSNPIFNLNDEINSLSNTREDIKEKIIKYNDFKNYIVLNKIELLNDNVISSGLGFLLNTKLIKKNKYYNYGKILDLLKKDKDYCNFIKLFNEPFITGNVNLKYYTFNPYLIEFRNYPLNEIEIKNEQIKQKNKKIKEENEIKYLNNKKAIEEQKRLNIIEKEEKEKLRIKIENDIIEKEKEKMIKRQQIKFKINLNCLKCLKKKDLVTSQNDRYHFCSNECKELIKATEEKYLSES
tara:strand:- start:1376 stop:2437 length:1062 start_codon:yes stop_codon:yes gene_type:complete